MLPILSNWDIYREGPHLTYDLPKKILHLLTIPHCKCMNISNFKKRKDVVRMSYLEREIWKWGKLPSILERCIPATTRTWAQTSQKSFSCIRYIFILEDFSTTFALLVKVHIEKHWLCLRELLILLKNTPHICHFFYTSKIFGE